MGVRSDDALEIILPVEKMDDLQTRLRAACNGHPAAKIPWPHRLLHEAADEIDRLNALVKEYDPYGRGIVEKAEDF